MSDASKTDFVRAFPGGQMSDRSAGSVTQFPESALEAVGPRSADEDDYIPEIFESIRPSDQILESVRRVSWAATDRASPCYSHLLVDGGDALKVEKFFELGKPELELLLTANRYLPRGHYDVLVFGLRGARLRNAEKFELADRIALEDARPDHVHFQCVIGFYFRTLGKLSAYTASTVPWHEYMSAGNLRYNLLPTGCYTYKKGAHTPKNESHWVDPALRLSDADGAQSGLATVLRTTRDAIFDLSDEWDTCEPSDNIHCAYSDTKFSSLGCQTVKGSMHDGLWARFQGTLKTLPASARVDYVLLTGAECSIAASLFKPGGNISDQEVLRRLGRLRVGSEGDEVNRLQAALGLPATGYFGPTTKKKLIEVQTAKQLPPDGIFSPDIDAKLGWSVFSGPVTVAVAASSGAVASAGGARVEAPLSTPAKVAVTDGHQTVDTPAPPQTADAPAATLLTEELLRKIAPRPSDPKKAKFWDDYCSAITSPEGAAVLAAYEVSKSPQRLVFILSNMFAETGGLSLIWESMAYSAKQMVKIFGRSAGISPAEAERLAFKQQEIAERVYGLGNPRKAKQLGNTQPGDGWRFRGGGFLQTTGRDNYRSLGRSIGADLEGHPELIENAIISLKAACAEWQRGGLNDYADRGSFRACCNGINTGNPKSSGTPNGFDDRLYYLQRGLKAFGLPPPKRAAGTLESTVQGLELGDIGSEVETLQRELNSLGYAAGEPDGVFTTKVRDALLLFQARNALATTGRADKDTSDALTSDNAVRMDEKNPNSEAAPPRASPESARAGRAPSERSQRPGLGATAVMAVISIFGIVVTLLAFELVGTGIANWPFIQFIDPKLWPIFILAGWGVVLIVCVSQLLRRGHLPSEQ